MDFKGYLYKGWDITKLDRDAAAEVARRPDSFWYAVGFFAIGGLAEGLGSVLITGGMSVVFAPVLAVLGSFIGAGVLHLVAVLLGGRAGFRPYYSALGIGSLPLWARIVPGLGHLVSLWQIPVTVIVTERVHRLSTGRAVFVALFPLMMLLVLIVVLVVLFGAAVIAGVLGFLGMAATTGPH